jgi:D-tyrosyl-tRNA(Tyr) deacylase
MKALIQRVTQASVEVNHQTVGNIGKGLLVLLGVEKKDSEDTALRMADKLLAYRVFADEQGKMNWSVRDIAGELLVVSQFTLAADTRKGLRPGFSGAAQPLLAEQLYDYLVVKLRQHGASVATGQFAADMKVQLVNDGPVTFLLEL